MLKVFTFASAAILLSACATAPVKQADLPAPPAAFTGPQAAATAPAPTAGQWWLIFHDDVLDGLIARAMSANNDVALASAHLEQARALLGSARSDLWPQLSAGYSPSRSTYLQPPGKAANMQSVSADLSYEVDLFGRLNRAAKAADDDAKASAALLKDAQLLIQSRVAESYFALRALDEDRAIVADTLAAYRQSLAVTQHRYDEGDVAELDLARMKTEVASTEAAAAALDQQRAQALHALAVLVGEPASGFELEAQRWAQQPWAGAVPVVPAGLPIDVLNRRPDLIAAEANLNAAAQRVGVAKAAWLPSLSLTAEGGYASPKLNNLFDPASATFTLAAALSQAVFDGGARKAGIDYARGGLDAAFASYRQTSLIAVQEVEDSLSDLDNLRRQEQAETDAVASASRAFDLSQTRYREGSSSQLDVLDAQRSYLTVRRDALRVRAAQYQASIALIRAIGGDWDGTH
jgi:multidrug efflux system outer membrane protein